MAWHHDETGAGRPLILLHGLGMSRAAWSAVIPYLRSTRRVIAFDIAGFGATPPLPRGMHPTIANLVTALVDALAHIGIETPVDIAGNSLGGSLALEAARRGVARSAVAIAPAGLWRDHDAFHVKYVFASLRFMARRFPGLMKRIVRRPLAREVALAVPLSAGSRRMPVADAWRAIDDLAFASAFEDTFAHTRAPFCPGEIAVPVTVIFGGLDWILTAQSRRRDCVPAHTRWIERPRWGHVPMWIDPVGVSQLILDGTR